MKLTFLGTGTSTGVPQIGCRCVVCTSKDPRDRRLRCSSLLEVEDETATDGVRRILIDCGPDFREQMLRIDFKPLDAILITHEHYDHVGGLDDLRPYSIFGNIVVYGEPYCTEHLRQRIPYCFTPKEKRYPGVPSIDLEDIEPGGTVEMGQVVVKAIRVMHGKMPILGFLFSRKDEAECSVPFLAYITDMKTIADEVVEQLHGIPTLVVNGLRHEPHPSHQTIEEAVAFSQRLGSPETYLIHMSHHIRPHAIEDAALPEHVHLAYDGQVVKWEI